ncbi:metal-dependent hydrolase [Haloferax sp. MBLA0076]|uniref:Metal-dependent hydrolase n=1 Tax=Haloferax litoreum TaxID=2666140 RepID=A0A6A8GKK0_9EURY|nr:MULTISPECIES: metal-dependent hydrolase [Haloferax]KAB1189952.1 metal-dependent hydrolase [Haloferax sp. CBA1148]MRX23723.1 metal-dependent hydrolase [Haloferax litoreum]
MWPWEHVAVGYLLVSVWSRVAKRPLDSRAAIAVLVGTQFPDLVDKPLAWSLDILPSGISVAHSIFVSVPLSILVVLVARRFEVTTVGVAFALGYLSHIPADLFYSGFFFGNYGALGSFLWPISHGPDSSAAGLFTQTWYYLSRFLVYLRQPEAWAYLLFEGILLGSAFLAWVSDGRPGLSLVKRSMNGIRRSVTR